MSIEEVVRLEECCSSDYAKRSEPRDDRVLGKFVNEVTKKELKSEPRKANEIS